MKNLIDSIPLTMEGVSEGAPKVTYYEKEFKHARNIHVQVLLTGFAMNKQEYSYWQSNVVIDSWVTKVNGVAEEHTTPADNICNVLDIKHCVRIRFRLEANNGWGAGIANIYAIK